MLFGFEYGDNLSQSPYDVPLNSFGGASALLFSQYIIRYDFDTFCYFLAVSQCLTPPNPMEFSNWRITLHC